jgi:hypothetical protein
MTLKVLIINKRRKDLDNFQGFQFFEKNKFQQFSVLLVLIKARTLGFQWRFPEAGFQQFINSEYFVNYLIYIEILVK